MAKTKKAVDRAVSKAASGIGPTDRETLEAVEAELCNLRNKLKQYDIYFNVALSAPEPDDERLGYALRSVTTEALGAVQSFLNAANMPSVALRRLYRALSDLEEGHSATLFAKRKIPHRPSDRSEISYCKAVAAAAMELLMEDPNLTKDQAAAKVARSLKKSPFRQYGGKDITPKLLSGWRDRYMSASDEADRSAAFWYGATVNIMRSKFSTPLQQAEGALANLPKILLTPPLKSTR